MGRPKGSRNVVRAKSDYKPEYAGMLLEFFRHYSEGEEVGVPTLQRFAQEIGTYTAACCLWVSEHEDFATAFVEAMRICFEIRFYIKKLFLCSSSIRRDFPTKKQGAVISLYRSRKSVINPSEPRQPIGFIGDKPSFCRHRDNTRADVGCTVCIAQARPLRGRCIRSPRSACAAIPDIRCRSCLYPF